jgi:hypothetical protein
MFIPWIFIQAKKRAMCGIDNLCLWADKFLEKDYKIIFWKTEAVNMQYIKFCLKYLGYVRRMECKMMLIAEPGAASMYMYPFHYEFLWLEDFSIVPVRSEYMDFMALLDKLSCQISAVVLCAVLYRIKKWQQKSNLHGFQKKGSLFKAYVMFLSFSL